MQHLQGENDDLNQHLQHWYDQAHRLDQHNRQLWDELQAKHGELQTLADHARELQDQLADAHAQGDRDRAGIARLEQELEEAGRDRARLEHELQGQREAVAARAVEIERLGTEHRRLAGDLEREMQRHQAEEERLLKEIAVLRHAGAGKEDRIAALTDELSSHRRAARELAAALGRAEAENEALRDGHARLARDHEAAIHGLHREYGHALEDMEDKHRRALRNLAADHDDEMARHRRELREAAGAEIAAQGRAYANRMDEIQRRADTQNARLAREISFKDREIEGLRGALDRLGADHGADHERFGQQELRT